MDYHYEILPKKKQHGLYRLEKSGTAVLLAYADDRSSKLRLVRIKALFEEDLFPLEELHAAAALSLTAPQTNKPSWGPVGLAGGGMEVWEISDAQARALKQIQEKKKDGLHRSLLDHRTVSKLVKHKLIKERKVCKAYLVITNAGNDLLKRIER